MVVRIMKMMMKQVDHKAAVVGIQGRAHVNVGHCHVEEEVCCKTARKLSN